MQRFSGKLINGTESFNWLTDALPDTSGTVSLCSAFLKIDPLRIIAEYIPSQASLRILVRWRAGDLLAGASDPECYELARDKGWDFYLKQDFHGKLYSVDGCGILVGSWNATSSGFGLKPGANDEIGTLVEQDSYNVNVVNSFFKSAVQVNDSLYSQIVQFLQTTPDTGTTTDYPLDLRTQLAGSTDEAGFLLSECFHSTPTEFFSNVPSTKVSVLNDTKLLGIQNCTACEDALIHGFSSTKIYRWILKTLSINGGSISFGGLTAALHDALLEDPKPYRSDIKILVQNLYSWIKFLGASKLKLEVIKPRHSEILRAI